MSSMKMKVLYLGRMEFLRLQLIACEDETELLYSPTVAILIQHPTLGNILYDTGNHPFHCTEYSADILETYPVVELISIEDALAMEGLKPSDIDILILSHLHFDHAGGLRYFRNTKAFERIVIAEDELKNACYSVMTGNGGAYIKSLFDIEGICFSPIEQDTELAPDLSLFIQKSHTPGVIGLLLKLQNSGNIIVTSDTIYLRDSFERALPPGGAINKTTDEFFDNLNYIKKLKEAHQAEIIYGHDYEQIIALNKKGWID